MRTDPMILAEASVPRYTSYPTAPHFSAAVDDGVYRAWLAALPAGEPLSLYIHVPFCSELCLYCGCNTKAVRRRTPVNTYADVLLREITMLGAAVGRRRISHLHWGGGTPSILGSTLLSELTTRIDCNFDLADLKEHAIELDPRTVTSELAQTLASIGVTRVSLGVQDFSEAVQQAIGRIQPYDMVARAVDAIRDAGIVALNFDLMYGLPKQTADSVRQSAALAAGLNPGRIALFGYAHVPWFKPHQRLIDESQLPNAAARLAQMEAARAIFIARGYSPIGLDHFAHPDDELALAARQGRLHRNFQGYTTDESATLIGLGASAIGRLPQGFVQNAPDIGSYARAITSGQFATRKGIALSADDRVRAAVIERLMCDFSVDLRSIAVNTQSAEQFEPEWAALQPLAQQGLVQLDPGKLSVAVTDQGRPFVRLIAATFDSYLQRDSQRRHSVAV